MPEIVAPGTVEPIIVVPGTVVPETVVPRIVEPEILVQTTVVPGTAIVPASSSRSWETRSVYYLLEDMRHACISIRSGS